MVRLHRFSHLASAYRTSCHHSSSGSSKFVDGFEFVEEPLKKMWRLEHKDCRLDEAPKLTETGAGDDGRFTARQHFFRSAKGDSRRILEVLRQDGPGFNTKAALEELRLRVSGLLVREVLLGILRSSNQSDCDELKAMWGLVDEMVQKGFPTTAWTFNILICTCEEAGLADRVVERFIKSKTLNFRPFKHSYNVILHYLMGSKQYKLIEWVCQQMLADGHSPDILSYNVVMCTNYRLGKLDKFLRLLNEMGKLGFSPDFHTYNILLHVLSKGNKPLAPLNLMNHMKEAGLDPSVLLLHFTTLMDGLSRAGNLDACRYFFDEMIKNDCVPDVVLLYCYCHGLYSGTGA